MNNTSSGVLMMTMVDMDVNYSLNVINGKTWFVCKICDNTDNNQQDIIRHIQFTHPTHCQTLQEDIKPIIPSMNNQERNQRRLQHINQLKEQSLRQMKDLKTFIKIQNEETVVEKPVDQKVSNGTSTRYQSNEQPIGSNTVHNTNSNLLKVQQNDIIDNPMPSTSGLNKTNNVSIKKSKVGHKTNDAFLGIKYLKDNYFIKKTIKGKQLICRFCNSCHYKTHNSRDMARHINWEHLNKPKYPCNQCHRMYTSEDTLHRHELYHRCGYSIDKVVTGVCSNDNLLKYRLKVKRKRVYYLCRFESCRFKTYSSSAIKDHIHTQHICPFRTNINKDNKCVSQDVRPIKVSNNKTTDGSTRRHKPNTTFRPLITGNTHLSNNTAIGDKSQKRMSSFKRDLLLKRDKIIKNSHLKDKRLTIKSKSDSIQLKGTFLGSSKVVLQVFRPNDRSINRHKKVSHILDKNYRGLQSLKNLKGRYFMEVLPENRKLYICKKGDYRTQSTSKMARHINCVHLRTRKFRCTYNGCIKVYNNPTSLRQHELNHLCGYGIVNGKQLKTVCGNSYLNQFRKRVIIDNIKHNVCIYGDCLFKTKTRSGIKRHIHNQHVCPNRVEYDITEPQYMDTEDINNMENTAEYDEFNHKITPSLQITHSKTISTGNTIKTETIDESNISNDYQLNDDLHNQQTDDNKSVISYDDISDEEISYDDISEEKDKIDDEIEIIYESIKIQMITYQELDNIVKENDWDFSCFDTDSHESQVKQVKRLLHIKTHFNRLSDGQYTCIECQFNAKNLKAIDMHLNGKHFI